MRGRRIQQLDWYNKEDKREERGLRIQREKRSRRIQR
jgi:hypothetical protein